MKEKVQEKTKGILLEFKSSPDSNIYHKSHDVVLPFEPYCPTATAYDFSKIRGVVRDALNCSLAAYQNLTVPLREFLENKGSVFPINPESDVMVSNMFGNQKYVMALSRNEVSGETTMFVAFRGTDKSVEGDIHADMDIEMREVEGFGNNGKLD